MLRVCCIVCFVLSHVTAEETINLGQGAIIQAIGSNLVQIVPNKTSNKTYYIRADSIAYILDQTTSVKTGAIRISTRDKVTILVPKKYVDIKKVLEAFDRK